MWSIRQGLGWAFRLSGKGCVGNLILTGGGKGGIPGV
jgi:hypothetical protein